MYKIKEINYNSNSFLNPLVIYYHRVLYKRYLDNLNILLSKNNYDYKLTKEELVNNLELFNIEDRGAILYNLGGVLNHELYFDNIDPNYKIDTNIIDKIILEYGSISNFKKVFKQESLKLVGSGYTFLVLDKNNSFNIINLSNQDTPLSYGFTQVLALDLWEHAYYLEYNVNKEEYIDDYLNNLFKDLI